MGNSKLVRTLATLSKDEWSSLRKYLLMNNREDSDTFGLFVQLQKRKEKLDKEFQIMTLGSKCFPKLSPKGFGNLQSRLNKSVEDWLAVSQFESEKYAKDLALVRALNSRGLYREANQVANKLEKRVNSNTAFDVEDSKALNKLYHAQYYSDNPVKYNNKEGLIESLVENHTKNYKYQSQLYLCELINWGTLNQIDFSKQLELLRSSIEKIDGGVLSGYMKDLEVMMDTSSYDNFESLADSLLEFRYAQGSELHTIMTLYLINYSLKFHMNKTGQDYELALKLNEYGLQTGVLMNSGKIPRSRFFNLVSTIGAIKTYEWTNDFINRWIEKVNSNDISSTLALAQAYNFFYHEKYSSVSSLLDEVKFDYLGLKIRALGLLLVTNYIEEYDQDIIMNQIENYKRMLKRNQHKVSLVLFKSHWNLIKVVEHLLLRDYSSCELNFNEIKQLVFRKWCQNQLEKVRC